MSIEAIPESIVVNGRSVLLLLKAAYWVLHDIFHISILWLVIVCIIHYKFILCIIFLFIFFWLIWPFHFILTTIFCAFEKIASHLLNRGLFFEFLQHLIYTLAFDRALLVFIITFKSCKICLQYRRCFLLLMSYHWVILCSFSDQVTVNLRMSLLLWFWHIFIYRELFDLISFFLSWGAPAFINSDICCFSFDFTQIWMQSPMSNFILFLVLV